MNDRLLPQKFSLTHNASTSPVMTRFFRHGQAHVLPAELFWDAFSVATDGIFFPEIDEMTFGIEIERVTNEIKTMCTQEQADVMKAVAHMNGLPYLARLITGSVEDVQAFTREDCLDFHRNYYTLSNTSIVLVGDVQHEREVAKLEKLFAGAVQKGLSVPAIEQRQFRSGEFRKPSDSKENEGTVRVDVIWPGNNYAEPQQAYATRLIQRQLRQFIAARLQAEYGLYNANFSSAFRDFVPYFVFRVEGANPQAAREALQHGLEILKSDETLHFLSEQHNSAIRQEEIDERTSQPKVQEHATRLMDLHTIGAPLDLFGPREIERFRNIRLEDVQEVRSNMLKTPPFLWVRGHEGALNSIPSVDELSGWLASPAVPGTRSSHRGLPKNLGLSQLRQPHDPH